jgi:hypothetical protein
MGDLIIYAAGIRINGKYSEFITSPNKEEVDEYLEIMKKSTPAYSELVFMTNNYRLISSTPHIVKREA